MLTSGISFVNFKKKNKSLKLKRSLLSIINEKNEILNSLSKNYRDSYKKNLVDKYKTFSNFRVIGMGGSILGTRTIYEFLKHKIKKNFLFIDNLQNTLTQSKKKTLNIIVSKSGNTIETIANSNIMIKKNNKNIFITENKKNYLYQLAENLKGEIVHHNNYIGGRYSVLSEVGMLPAELMGLKAKNFRQFNYLIKRKRFLNSLINNVGSIIYYIKNRKFNSIIINYDEKSESLFKWYQQLVAESLGKKKKGLLPIVSNMPKDNHSVMQLYLDGFQNNFYTFFYVDEKKSKKLNNKIILPSHKFLKNKSISKIIYSQKKASENIFLKKNIPFRSFEVKKRDEKTLGELFSFFILETILLGKVLNLNPYDQPAVELIKKETKKILR
tara:strand:+ start:302 stop:1453 length:1152 start_codon:yes stop_codon:yes gene_type:complete